MKILIVSRFGDSYGLGWRLAQEGSQVDYFIEDKKYQVIGQGVQNPRRVGKIPQDFYDLTLFDMTGLGALADKMRADGRYVVGGSAIADKLEKDRSFAMSQVKLADLPDYKEFSSIQDGIKFLEEAEDTYCFKPDNMPTEWTFVPKDDGNESVIAMMQVFPKKNHPFILQQKVDGIEVSTEGWFDGYDFVRGTFNHTIERKRFLEGDRGRNVGCMGNIVWGARDDDELVEILLKPLTMLLRAGQHVGPVDANAKVMGDKCWFLEFTPRLGYDSIQTWMAMQENKAQWLMNLGKGEKISEEFGIGVRLSLSPYPYSEDIAEAARGLDGIPSVEMTESFWPADYKAGGVLAGVSGILGVVTSVHKDLEMARVRVYRQIDRITRTSDVQFRSDIGENDTEKISLLQAWGWL